MFNRINNNTSKILKDGQINEEILDNIISNLEEITRENSYDNWSQGWGDEERDDGTASAHYGPMDNENKSWSQGWEDEERDDGTVSAHYGPMNDEIKWNSKLTPEQIDELKAEGLEPGDPEYDQYLLNHGIKSEVKKEENNVVKNQIDVLKKKIADLEQKHLDAKTMEEKEKLMEEIQKARDELSSLRKGEKNPEQQNENKPKDDFQPPAVTENKGKNNETPKDDFQPPAVIENKEKNDEISKTFEEILADIEAAKNAVSDAQYSRYQSANGPWLVPVQKDEGDWLRNFARGVVGGIVSVINIPRKLINKIRTTAAISEKIENAQYNVDQLSAQDFKTLRDGLQGYKGHENKVSISVWEAVKNREAREMNQRNQNRNGYIQAELEAVREDYQRSLEIENELNNNTSLTPEERAELEAEKAQIDRDNADSVRKIEEERETGAIEQGGAGYHGLEEEGKARREGSNMSGRKFARRYSTNEELEKEQAELKRLQREARGRGDNFTETAAFLEHEDVLNENTYDQNFLGIRISRSDRHHDDVVFSKSYQEDDLLRNTLMIATTVASIINIYKQIENQKIVNEANEQINNANAHNQNMASRAEQMRQDVASQETTVNNGIEASKYAKKGATWAAGHEHAGAAENYTNNWGSTNLDEQFHKAINGQMDDASMKAMIQNAKPVIEKYAVQNPKYDYTALLDAMDNLGNGGLEALTAYNNAMKTIVGNAINAGQFTAEQVNNFSISPTFLETMMPVVLAGYAATSKEYKRSERRAARRMKNEQSKEMEQEEQPEEPIQDNNEEER